ncbi:hypothetical protein [Magnetospirillum aberrantis]|uniref:Uncharacterized protein n=1 Tax=Magnetospirillum aberrantis SpK TaxID=908842 RepID=A0A7C9QUH7_9PROT|nr:hypothetical protein [Magnetospirillum aberrantis]NFV80677.1 hypothetical protein [Magnetospirillum aberrantis SpK]
MPAHHREPVDIPMPDAFIKAASTIKAEMLAEKPHAFLFDHREQRAGVIDRLLQSTEVAFHAEKALRLTGGLEVLCTLAEAAMHLPENLATTDARPPSEKRQYLEALQNQVNGIIVLLDQDRPCGSELEISKPTSGQWPPHPFYRDSLLEGLVTEPFRLGRHLEFTGRGGATCAEAKARLPLSRLHRLLGLVEKSLARAIPATEAETNLNKGNGALRIAIYALNDSLGKHTALFAQNPRRVSRNGLIAAFIKAACPDQFAFNAMPLTQKEVSDILKDRERREGTSQSAKRAQKEKSGPIS